jgi:hypothetical protein
MYWPEGHFAALPWPLILPSQTPENPRAEEKYKLKERRLLSLRVQQLLNILWFRIPSIKRRVFSAKFKLYTVTKRLCPRESL